MFSFAFSYGHCYGFRRRIIGHSGQVTLGLCDRILIGAGFSVINLSERNRSIAGRSNFLLFCAVNRLCIGRHGSTINRGKRKLKAVSRFPITSREILLYFDFSICMFEIRIRYIRRRFLAGRNSHIVI